MTVTGWAQILVFCAIIVALAKPLGAYMIRVFDGERTFLPTLALGPVVEHLAMIAGQSF